ncbi:MAG: hypothetical protein Q4A06_00060 [Cardiobacteriaceae bacterium]|nr:hypothetical protein [Cardiobacteriaceae bacterium]
MICIAFFKGHSPYLSDRLIRWITKSAYSHCEIAIAQGNGNYRCLSSHARDGGVREKFLHLAPERWDIVPAPIGEKEALSFFEQEKGSGYDYAGVLRFVFPFLRASKTRWFCSEFVAAALGMETPERQSPQDVFAWLQSSKSAR